MVLKAFRFRLLPTAEQVVFLNKCMGCSRFIYNQMLADKKAYYEEHGEPLFSNTPATYKATFPLLIAECSNYQKQRLKVAKLHAKIANQRKDTLHKLTTNLVKNHDLLVIEDLAPSNLMKNRKLSRAIANVSWSTFKTFLTYKAEWYGKQVVTISRWYPSSQLCSNCNTSSGKKPLHVRDWTCEACGAHHDRDVNAAKNILHEGLRLA